MENNQTGTSNWALRSDNFENPCRIRRADGTLACSDVHGRALYTHTLLILYVHWTRSSLELHCAARRCAALHHSLHYTTLLRSPH